MIKNAGFVDKKKTGYFVHDWDDKYNQLDSYRKMNAKRQPEYRKRKKWRNLIKNTKKYKRRSIQK